MTILKFVLLSLAVAVVGLLLVGYVRGYRAGIRRGRAE